MRILFFLTCLFSAIIASQFASASLLYQNKNAIAEKIGTCESAAQDGLLMFERSEISGIVTLKEQLFLLDSNIYLLRNQVVYTELDGIKSITVTCSRLNNEQ